MVLRIGICDDEDCYRQKTRAIVENRLNELGYNERELLLYEDCNRLLEDKEVIESLDVIFLDINFGDGNGLNAAAKIKALNKDVLIIFVTSYIEYSLEGYKVNALRYVLKNNMEFSVNEALEAAIEKINSKRSVLEFEFSEGKKAVKVEDIIYVESEKHRLVFHIKSDDKIEKYSMYGKLDDIEAKLSDKLFIRIHKSYLINYRHIRALKNYMVMLDNGVNLNSSRNRFKEARDRYYELKGGLM